MEILFLGTGPAVGIPRPGHRDPACRQARKGGKSRRTRSSALVSAGNARLLIDAGPDILEQLERESVDRIDAVLLTHGHADASGGLQKLNSWFERRPHACTVPVYTDRITQQRLRKHFGELDCLQWITIDPLDALRFRGTEIRPFAVMHSMTEGFPTFGFLINKQLAYASDVADIPPESQRLIHGVHLLVLDAAFRSGKKMLPSHLTSDEAIAWGEKLCAKKLILTQIGHTYPPHEEAQKKIKGALLAYDGLRIKLRNPIRASRKTAAICRIRL